MLAMIKGFNIFGLEIRFYGLIIALGFVTAFFLIRYLLKKSGELNPDITFDLILIIFPLALIGARLYYIIFSGRSWTFLEAISIWNGGIAIYGGIIGGFIGVVIYSLIKKINILKLTDVIAVGLIIAQSMGRWGNFFNQEAYGYMVTNESLQWFPFAVFIEELGTWHLATFFYESLWNFLGFILLFFVYNKIKQLGLTTGIYLSFYALGRFFIEGLRTDSLYIGSLRVSQVLSIVLFLLGVAVIVYSCVKERQKRNEQKPST